jgi:hypothetical protein
MQRRDFFKVVAPASLLLLDTPSLFAMMQTVAATPLPSSRNEPFYPPENKDPVWLAAQCEPYLKLSANELLALVPPQGGFYFGPCPNCTQGDEENNIIWNLSLGDKVQCKFCKEILPSEKYPENSQLVLDTPTGKKQTFKYHENAQGKKYWLESRKWYEQLLVMQRIAYYLAQLNRLDPTRAPKAGEYSALILKRFVELYPDYIPRFDYPFRDKKFYTTPEAINEYITASNNGGDYRIAKWSWWAYMDVSRDLLLAYDQLAGSDLLTAAERQTIEKDFFGGMLESVEKYRNVPLSNMDPTLWTSQAIASQVLLQSNLKEHVLERINALIANDFTYDGYWKEGTASYHVQTVNGLRYVLGFFRPHLKGTAFDEWFAKENYSIYRTFEASKVFEMPNGRYAAVHDSWAKQACVPTTRSQPYLMGGMGYGILGSGEKEQQIQAHLNFSGRFGHAQYDSLNLLLFGAGKELVSELGYSWTKARPWTMTTVAHNTVTIDQKNQEYGAKPINALGTLQAFHAGDKDFQIVKASATECYPGVAQKYERTLILVGNDKQESYVVDIFEVEGGNRHDWFLHGSADEEQAITLTNAANRAISLTPTASLLPTGFVFKPLSVPGAADFALIHNGPWAFGNFRDVQSARSTEIIKATYKSLDNGKGALDSWILPDKQSEVSTMRSWNVRGTGVPHTENQDKLDEHLRSSLMVTRYGGKSRFVAVHVPYQTTSPVTKVSQVNITNGATLLKVERGTATDYILISDGQHSCVANDQGRAINFNGKFGLISLDGTQQTLKMLDGTRLSLGSKMITGTVSAPAALLNIQGNVYTVQGSLKLAAGDVFIIHHGNGRTSSFHVKSIRQEAGNTRIETTEPPVFEGQTSGTLKMLTFPRLELPAPHSVSFNQLTTS